MPPAPCSTTDLREEVLGAGRYDQLDDLHASVRAAREVADRVEPGNDVDPGDVGQVIQEVRAAPSRTRPADVG